MLEGSSPQETAEVWLASGEAKHAQSVPLILLKSVLAGMLLSIGAMLALSFASVAESGSASQKLLFAAVFPIGLVMITLTGAELLTSNMAIVLVSAIKRRVPLWAYPFNLALVTTGNLAGSLLAAGLLAKASGIFDDEPYHSYVYGFAYRKVHHPSWAQILVKGIGCNFLVCVAVFQAAAARDIVSKIVAVILPVFAFVALTFDHVVANMLFVPLAMMLGESSVPVGTAHTGHITIGYYIWKSMIPSYIGNVLGAAFLAVPLVCCYLGGVGREATLPLTSIIASSTTSGTPKSLLEEKRDALEAMNGVTASAGSSSTRLNLRT